MTETPRERLESIRRAIHAEHVSQGELIELANLAPHIEPWDVELLEWAGVPEFPDDDDDDDDKPNTAAELADVALSLRNAITATRAHDGDYLAWLEEISQRLDALAQRVAAWDD